MGRSTHVMHLDGNPGSGKELVGSEFEPLAARIPTAIAAVTGRDPIEGPPLQQFVDVDALEQLLASGGSRTRVSFTYDGMEVTVSSDGRVEIAE